MSIQPSDRAPEPQHPAKASRASTVGRTLRTVFYVLIAVLTTIFLLSNSDHVRVNYIFGSAYTPLFVALGIAMILGALLVLGAVGIWKVRHRDRSS